MKSNQALLVVDVQNDFMEWGPLPVPKASEVIFVINKLTPLFSCVVFTQDFHPADHVSFAKNHPGKQPYETVRLSYGEQMLWPVHCVENTQGADFAIGLDTPLSSYGVQKGTHRDVDSYSAFLEADRKTDTGLASALKQAGIDEVFLCGVATDYCVYWTAKDAVANGFKVYLIEDACRGIDINGSVEKALESMKQLGVQIVRSADLLRKTNDLNAVQV